MTKTLNTIKFALLAFVVASLAVVGLASAANGTETEFEVKDGGAHCQTGPLGNHWRWDVRIIPGSQASSYWISAPWEIVNVDGPNANDRLILHTISYEPDPSGTATVTVNGEGYDVTPTLHYSDKCPVPPVETCETNPELCPPPPVEEVTVCRDGELITIPADEVLDTDTEECPTIVPEPPATPEVPELVPPVVVTSPPAQSVPAPPATEVGTPAELAFTGATTDILTAAGLVLLLAGFFIQKGRKSAKRDLNF